MSHKDLNEQAKILVIDDEPDLVELLTFNLQKCGYIVQTAGDGRRGLDLARKDRPDLAIVDIMMPGLDGVELVRRLRSDPATTGVPVLMLTAKASEADELAGLGVGADDYVTKPFSMKVLLARVEALRRRAREPAITGRDELAVGDVRLDLGTHEAFLAGKPLQLTRTEFRILAALMGAHGRVLSRSALIGRAMGVGVAVTRRTIDVHVTSLRRKLGEHASMIRTVRGVGYRVVEPGTPDDGLAGDQA
ncbi:MAG: response regulator transcription factor [Phycisphaeraceae bacterium]|nr:response regulator transcription factor [Phycisphaeraceae bacterium]